MIPLEPTLSKIPKNFQRHERLRAQTARIVEGRDPQKNVPILLEEKNRAQNQKNGWSKIRKSNLGAVDRIRTGDILLGKQTFYQLNYHRILNL